MKKNLIVKDTTKDLKDVRMSFIILQSANEKKLTCAEVGVWTGENAFNMLTIDPEMELHLIDDYTNIAVTDDNSQGNAEEVSEKARVRLEPFKDRVKFVYKQSEEAFLLYPDYYFDYVYIDGDHSYWGAYRDIKLWYPKVKVGGLLAGHDIGMPSVAKAVLDFTIDERLTHRTKVIDAPPESDFWIIK